MKPLRSFRPCWPPALLAAFLLLAAGCGGRGAAPSLPPPAAPEVWGLYQRSFALALDAPSPRLPEGARGLHVKASLVYSGKKRGNRTALELWGSPDYPLRVDVRAGVGAVLALVREDADGLLAVHPESNEVYFHEDPVAAARTLGIPLPFSVRDLAMVLTGALGDLVPAAYDWIEVVPQGLAYSFDSGRITRLILSPQGRPLALEGMGEGPWRLDLADWAEGLGVGPGWYRRLSLTLPGQESAVIHLKTLSISEKPWPDKALELDLPPGARFLRLDKTDPGLYESGSQPGSEVRP